MITLKNDYLSVDLHPKGAEIHRIIGLKDDLNYMWRRDPSQWANSAPILFPIVGAVRDDTYRVEGKTYHLTQHGFARHNEFEVTSQSDTEVVFTLRSNPDILKQYPYPVSYTHLQIPGEQLKEGQSIKVYVTDVENSTKGTHVNVSRTDPQLVKRLFELEVPEIFEGTVEIKSVSREAGERTKIAVYAQNDNIDPIGACVGPKGTRVRNVVEELNGEMIDIIEYSEDPKVFISNALSRCV